MPIKTGRHFKIFTFSSMCLIGFSLFLFISCKYSDQFLNNGYIDIRNIMNDQKNKILNTNKGIVFKNIKKEDKLILSYGKSFKTNKDSFPTDVVFKNVFTNSNIIINTTIEENYYDENKIKLNVNQIPEGYYVINNDSSNIICITSNFLYIANKHINKIYYISSSTITLLFNQLIFKNMIKKITLNTDQDRLFNFSTVNNKLLIDISKYQFFKNTDYKFEVWLNADDDIPPLRFLLNFIEEPKINLNNEFFLLNDKQNGYIEIKTDEIIKEIFLFETETNNLIKLNSSIVEGNLKNNKTYLYPLNNINSNDIYIQYSIYNNTEEIFTSNLQIYLREQVKDLIMFNDEYTSYFINKTFIMKIRYNDDIYFKDLDKYYDFTLNPTLNSNNKQIIKGNILSKNYFFITIDFGIIQNESIYTFKLIRKNDNKILYEHNIYFTPYEIDNSIPYSSLFQGENSQINFNLKPLKRNAYLNKNVKSFKLYFPIEQHQSFNFKNSINCSIFNLNELLHCIYNSTEFQNIPNEILSLYDYYGNKIVDYLLLNKNNLNYEIKLKLPREINIGDNTIELQLTNLKVIDIKKIDFINRYNNQIIHIDKNALIFAGINLNVKINIKNDKDMYMIYQIYTRHNIILLNGFSNQVIKQSIPFSKIEYLYNFYESGIKKVKNIEMKFFFYDSKLINKYVNEIFINKNKLSCKGIEYSNLMRCTERNDIDVPSTNQILFTQNNIFVDYLNLVTYSLSMKQLFFINKFNNDELIININHYEELRNMEIIMKSDYMTYPFELLRIEEININNKLIYKYIFHIKTNFINPGEYNLYAVFLNSYKNNDDIAEIEIATQTNIIIKYRLLDLPEKLIDLKKAWKLDIYKSPSHLSARERTLLNLHSLNNPYCLSSILLLFAPKNHTIIPQYCSESSINSTIPKLIPKHSLKWIQNIDESKVKAKYDYVTNKKEGFGAEGTVYKATFIPTKLPRAIKKIEKVYTVKNIKEKTTKTRYLYNQTIVEIDLLKDIDHPFIFKVYEVYESKDTFWLISEFIKEKNLNEFLRKKPQLNERDAALLIYEIFYAVNYLNKKDILHRDVTMFNVMIDKFKDNVPFIVKLIDFDHSIRTPKTPFINKTFEEYEAETVKFDSFYLGLLMMKIVNKALDLKIFGIPFNDQKKMISEVNIDKYKFTEKLSKECRDLIKKLVNINGTLRIDIDEALDHPWFKINEAKQRLISFLPYSSMNKMMDNLYNYVSWYKNILQISALKYIVRSNYNNYQNLNIVYATCLFIRIDEDNDGRISKKEFMKIEKIFHDHYFNGEFEYMFLEQLFYLMDANNCGYIENEDFVVWVLGVADIVHLNDNYDGNILDAFKYFDMDNDGIISEKDLIDKFELFDYKGKESEKLFVENIKLWGIDEKKGIEFENFEDMMK